MNKKHTFFKNPSRIGITTILILFSILVQAKDFYVSPEGDDANSGTKAAPFKTLVHTQQEVRNWKQLNPHEDITVWLSGGEYRLSETLVFGLEDGASIGNSISYTALPGDTPIINSDITISGWKEFKKKPLGLSDVAYGNVWVASVPANAKAFNTMYNAKGMLPRARTKAMAHILKDQPRRGPEDSMPFEKGTTKELFSPLNAEIVVIPKMPWTMNILPVESVDHKTGMVKFKYASTYGLSAPWMKDETIWVENTFAGLDEPGEWVYDEKERLLYYWPEGGAQPGDDIVIPQLIEMIRVEGMIDYDGPKDTPVNGLNFKGITFNHGNRYESAGGTGLGLQHDWERFDESTALLRFRGAENCSVENCFFIQSGGTGVRLDLHAQNIRIHNNEFSDLGGGGVLLAGYGPGTKDVNKNNEVSNNYIHHTGEFWWHTIGIWAWQSGQNRISHNTIHHMPYTAIAVTGRIRWDKTGKAECSKTIRWKETNGFNGEESWEERERFLHGRLNIIENNDIHHVVEIMFDGNGVYISGAGQGNVVKGNYVHDTPTENYGEAIRCDNDQNETLMENNVVFRYGAHGIGFTSKGRNHIINNIVAYPPHKVKRGIISLEPINDMINAGSKVFNNIIYATQADQPIIYRKGMDRVIETIESDRNIYFNAIDPEAANEYLEFARSKNKEINSMQADPMFVDIENGNFELKANSPAIKLGFRPFVLNAGRIEKGR